MKRLPLLIGVVLTYLNFGIGQPRPTVVDSAKIKWLGGTGTLSSLPLGPLTDLSQNAADSAARALTQIANMRIVNVLDYGIIGDSSDVTTSLQTLITLKHASGGGTLIFPSGSYATSALTEYADVRYVGYNAFLKIGQGWKKIPSVKRDNLEPSLNSFLSAKSRQTSVSGLMLNGTNLATIHLDSSSAVGAASIRQSAFVYDSLRTKWYMIADVVLLSDTNHPNTFNGQIHLWSLNDSLTRATYIGVAIPRGTVGLDELRASSPAGMTYRNGRIYAPYCGTSVVSGNSICLATTDDPETVPWTKRGRITSVRGDGPSILAMPNDDVFYCYFNTNTGDSIKVMSSTNPIDSSSWTSPIAIIAKHPRTQSIESPIAKLVDGQIHIWCEENILVPDSIAGESHFVSSEPLGPFTEYNPVNRFILKNFGDYIAVFSVVERGGEIIGAFWTQTMVNSNGRYGLIGKGVVTKNILDGGDNAWRYYRDGALFKIAPVDTNIIAQVNDINTRQIQARRNGSNIILSYPNAGGTNAIEFRDNLGNLKFNLLQNVDDYFYWFNKNGYVAQIDTSGTLNLRGGISLGYFSAKIDSAKSWGADSAAIKIGGYWMKLKP